jgi:hypothetical protein
LLPSSVEEGLGVVLLSSKPPLTPPYSRRGKYLIEQPLFYYSIKIKNKNSAKKRAGNTGKRSGAEHCKKIKFLLISN